MKHARRADDSSKLRVFNLWRGESTSACRLSVSFSTCGRVGTTRVSGGPAGCCFPFCAFFRRSDRPVLGRCWARASDFSGRPGRTLGVVDASLLFPRLRVLMDRWRAKLLRSGQRFNCSLAVGRDGGSPLVPRGELRTDPTYSPYSILATRSPSRSALP